MEGHFLNQCTMGPQPDLPWHQRFRRLVASGVKCISNYSELSTYHEYGNIFFDIMSSFRVTRAWSQNSEIITGNQVAAREKCRLIDAQKLQPYIFWNAIGGTHVLTGTPGCTFEASNVSYFCFACVVPFFVNISKDLVFVCHQQCSLMPIF